MRAFYLPGAYLFIVFLAAIVNSLPVRNRINKSSTVILNARTRLYLKVGADRRDRDSRQPVKTGTHTYASWKSPDLKSDDYNSQENFEGDDEEEDYDDEDVDDESYDSQSDIEPPSAILVWMRKLYDSMFFYGLDPAPPSQQNNRRKMMRDAENNNGKKNNSPFFTPSEQRVQRYMTSVRNQENSKDNAGKDRENDRKFKSNVQKSDRSNRQPESTISKNDQYRNQGTPIRREGLGMGQSSQMQKSESIASTIDDLNSRILDVTQELELVDAELITSSQNDREYPILSRRRNTLLDYIEDLEVELVTEKSRML